MNLSTKYLKLHLKEHINKKSNKLSVGMQLQTKNSITHVRNEELKTLNNNVNLSTKYLKLHLKEYINKKSNKLSVGMQLQTKNKNNFTYKNLINNYHKKLDSI